MSLTFQSLAQVALFNAPAAANRMLVYTPSGYRNLELGALRDYVNAPMLDALDEAMSHVGPTIWPAAKSITLTGPVTGTVSMDGSSDVTLSTSIPANALSQSMVNGLATALAGKLDGTATAVAATKLASAKNIALSGVVTGSVAFDGTGNVSIPTTIADGALSIAKTLGLQTALDRKAATTDPALSGRVTIKSAEADGSQPGYIRLYKEGDPDVGSVIPGESQHGLLIEAPKWSNVTVGITPNNPTDGFSIISTPVATTSEPPYTKLLFRVTNAEFSYNGYSVYHSGNLNPSSFATATHNHNGVYALIDHTHTPETTVAGRVRVWDDRTAATTPGGANNSALRVGLQLGQNLGLATGNFFSTLQIDPGADDTVGYSFQLALNSTSGSGIRYRAGKRTGGWVNEWYTVWDSANFNPKAPVPDEGILTVGNPLAETTRFKFDGTMSHNGETFAKIWTANNFNPNDYYRATFIPAAYENPDIGGAALRGFVTGVEKLGSTDPWLSVFNFGIGGNRQFQLGSYYGEDTHFCMRSMHDFSGNWKPWVELWHTGNFNPATYQPTLPGRLNGASYQHTDWNTAAENGWWMGLDAANAPGPGWYIGTVAVHNPNWITQEVWLFSSGQGAEMKHYRRQKINGTWSSWTAQQLFDGVGADRIWSGFDANTSNSISCSNWFRSSDQTGWYNASYGGGIYMTDSTYVRAYNGTQMAAADFVVTSDERLKEELGPLTLRHKLRPFVFRWRDTGELDFGFGASEVEFDYPEAVGEIQQDHGMLKGEMIKQLSYQKLTAVLAAQNNQQQDEIDHLRSEVQELRALVTGLLEKK